MNNATEYNHPQRYTGKDGKDLIDRLEEGMIPKEQTERISKRQHLEVRNEIRKQRRHKRPFKSTGISKASDCI